MSDEERKVEWGGGWRLEVIEVEIGAVDEDAAECGEEGLGLAGGGRRR